MKRAIFYFSPNVKWDIIEEMYGFDSWSVDNLSYAQCKELEKFAFKEWGGEIESFTFESFQRAFNDSRISDEGYIRIFE